MEHPHNRNAYTNGKATFVTDVLAAAGITSAEPEQLIE